jgi:hypothetical protein
LPVLVRLDNARMPKGPKKWRFWQKFRVDRNSPGSPATVTTEA